MPDIRELKDQASRLLSKGKHEKAIAAYEELCKLEPRDMQMRVRLGDACVKNGEKPRAIEVYRVAAETYAREGFLPRSIAVCKLILELDPSHVATQQTLAQLYARKSGRSEVRASPPPAPKPQPVAAPAPAPARAAAKAPQREGGLELDTSERSFSPGVAASEEAAEAIELEPSGIELDTSGSQAAWKGAPAWEAPAATTPAAPAVPPGRATAPAAPSEPPQRATPPASVVAARPAAAPTQSPAPAEAKAAEEPALSLELELEPEELSLSVELQPEPVALEAPSAPAEPIAAGPTIELTAAEASPQPEDAGGEDVLFSGDAPAPSAGFSLGEVELGEPELPASEPVVADSLAAALQQSATGGAERAETAGNSWFAPPEETPPESLAALGIANVDEDAEIEILTVSSDEPPSADQLPEIPLFSDLSREAFVDLASRCTLVRPEPGEVIIREGSIGTSFFVVSSGSVRICKGETTVARLKEGSFFGEMALLSGAPRAASVIAEEETECLEISAALLADLQHRYPHVGQVLKKFARQRLLANVLATSPLFRPFDKKERNALVERFKARDVQPGESVLEEGKLSDGLFVAMSGELEVRKGKGSDQIVLASLKEGDVFGEISLLTKSGATATVVARRRSTVLRMPREAFDEVISTHPQVLMLVSELSDERLHMQEAIESGKVDASDDGLMLL